MMTRRIYTGDVSQNLGKCIGDCPGNIEMNSEMNLLRFVDIWLEVFKKNSIKAGTYGRLITSRNALEKYEISNKAIGEIDFFDIQKYINSVVADGYSVGEVKKRMLIVTAPLKQAAAMRIISADPCVGLKLPTEENVKKRAKEIVAYTKEEQEKFTRIIQLEPENVGYLAVAFMIETGIRCGELLALKWTDLQMDRCRMHVHATIVNPMYNYAAYQDSPKSKSSNRILPLTPRALQILKSLIKRRKTEWVFEQDGKRYTYQKLMYQTKKLCRECGVKYYGEHAFRHTFATNCYYKGIDVKILSRMMGHSSVQVTYNIYINLYGDGFDDMYAALCF
jgi:integrase